MHTQLFGLVQVYANMGGHFHSVRKPANASADDTHTLVLLGWSAYRVWASVGRLKTSES